MVFQTHWLMLLEQRLKIMIYCVHVSAPTVSAAFNACGETMQRLRKGGIYFKNLQCCGHFAERRMLKRSLLGCAKKHRAQTVHEGEYNIEGWGGIPAIALFGDYDRLPPSVYTEATHSYLAKIDLTLLQTMQIILLN